VKIVRRSQIQNSPSQCPRCKSASIRERRSSDTIDFRGMELDVEGLSKQTCESCRYVWETPAQLAHNQVLIRAEYTRVRDEARARFGLLSGERIAAIRDQLGLTQRDASSLFGGGANAFNKYESGEVLQSFAMDRLIRLTVAVGARAVAFLRDVEGHHDLRTPAAQPLAATSMVAYMSPHSVPDVFSRYVSGGDATPPVVANAPGVEASLNRPLSRASRQQARRSAHNTFNARPSLRRNTYTAVPL
jgi:putative zinc finger/helix-turn-helix YgiT family protein